MFKQAVGALFKFFLAICLSSAWGVSVASAQSAEGYIGWASAHTSEVFPSADAACRSQWQHYMGGHAKSRYIGAFSSPGGLNDANCSWTHYQYLCPAETGGGILSCWTTYPSYVWFNCKSGYTPTLGKYCLKDPVPECPKCRNNGSSTNPERGDPIVLSTGSVVARARDYGTADDQFVIGRSYRSIQIGRSAGFQSPVLGLAGGWNLDFMYELQLAGFSGSPTSPNAKLALVAPDGTANDFLMQSGGAWVPNTATGAFYAPTNLKIEYIGTLPADLSTVQSASTQWRVTDGDDTVWVFQTFTRPNRTPFAVGRPISRTTKDGYRWDFAYRPDNSLQTVTDSFGRQATFNWSNFYISSLASPPAGSLPYPEAIASIALPDGTSLRYTYDPPAATAPPSQEAIERLIKVERLDAGSAVLNSTSYSYEDPRFPNHLTATKDMSGVQVATYAYDARGRGTASTHADGTDKYTVASVESPSEIVRSVTNPLGKVENYHFARVAAQDHRLSSVQGDASANTPASTRSITYGINRFIATQTDEEGRVTAYTRDTRGRPITIVEAQGTPQARTTTITWNSSFNVPDRIVRPGLQIDYTYTSTGQIQTVTETDTTTHAVPYSTAGQTRTWTYAWGAGGRLVSINGPKPVDSAGKDDTLAFAYDPGGNLLTSTNGLGQVTTLAGYDPNGRPGTMTDPNGIVTAFTYDGLGRTKTVTSKHPANPVLDATTTLDYDAHDRVTGIASPATDKLFIDYDAAGRLTAVRAASGERIDYQSDAHGNITRETVKRGDSSVVRSVATTFDELSRTLTTTLGAGRTTTLAYDKVDNPTQTTSGRNFVTQTAFDPLNRLVSTIAPDTGTSSTAYNAQDEVISFTDPISVPTTFVRNGFGDVVQEVSPDRGTSTLHYNEAGELTASIDGRGQRVDYTRDILGRVTQKVPQGRPASETITYAWDAAGISGSYGIGRLSSVTDGTGTTALGYDHRGNLIAKRQNIGSGTADLAYIYDAADRITQIAYPSGRLVAYDRDSKGRVTQVRTKASTSDPTWALLAGSITYDPWGSVTAAQFGNGLALQQAWFDGRLTSKRLYNATSGANLSSLAYGYDNDDNIGAIHDLIDDANTPYYGYDAVGRMTLSSMVVSSPASSTDTYNYTSGTNRLASITNAAGTRGIGYDARGNTISESRPGGSVSATYDGYGRLLTYNRTGDPAQTNAYNGLDDRVSTTSGSTTHAFVYDADGRVLGEYGTSAADVIAETIWLSPDVANDNQPFGGDDGVGGYAPLVVATGSGSSTTLTWVHGNHLGVPIAFTDASGAAVVAPSYALPGFPGQMKTLSDIYYNRYRDYDSSTGRYVQADPIGLEGGSNPFAYANDNPLRYVDPLGLTAGALLLPLMEGGGLLAFCAEPVGWVVCGGTAVVGAVALYRSTHGNGYDGSGSGTSSGSGCEWEDECEDQYLEDQANCLTAKFREGKAGQSKCLASAMERYSECRRAKGRHGIRTQLYLGNKRW